MARFAPDSLNDDLEMLVSKVNLADKLAEFGLSPGVDAKRRRLHRIFARHSPAVLAEVYALLHRIPRANGLLQARDVDDLKARQSFYWRSLFGEVLDEAMVRRSVMVGLTHYRIGLAQHLYIAGYAAFQTELLKAVLTDTPGDAAEPLLREAVGLIHLDMSISLTAFFYFGMRRLEVPRLRQPAATPAG